MSFGYDYRPDGRFLVKWNCQHCGEEQESIALANRRDYCDACEQMLAWEEDSKDGLVG